MHPQMKKTTNDVAKAHILTISGAGDCTGPEGMRAVLTMSDIRRLHGPREQVSHGMNTNTEKGHHEAWAWFWFLKQLLPIAPQCQHNLPSSYSKIGSSSSPWHKGTSSNSSAPISLATHSNRRHGYQAYADSWCSQLRSQSWQWWQTKH